MMRYLVGIGLALVVAVAGLGYAASGAGADLADPPIQRVEIEASARGFVPASVELKAGVPAELVFTRTTASGCAAQVHIPDMDVPRTRLPQGEPVTIRIEAPESGSYAFLCGMDMLEGTIMVMQ